MKLSLAVGVLMLVGKGAAWWITGSAAILSDALESVVHVVAVGFAAFSLWLSMRPATKRFHYGYERISFFSAGFEGAMIIVAAIAIIAVAVQKWIAGLSLEQLGFGTWLVAGAGALNGALGWYLIYTGKSTGSLILVANGKHVLTDCWTSAGLGVGLLLVHGRMDAVRSDLRDCNGGEHSVVWGRSDLEVGARTARLCGSWDRGEVEG